MPITLITQVRPHICHYNALEVGSSDCRYGCKVFQCSVCHAKSVVHSWVYGCQPAPKAPGT